MTYIVALLASFIYAFGNNLDGNINIVESWDGRDAALDLSQVRMTRAATDVGPMLIDLNFARTPSGATPIDAVEFRSRVGGGNYGSWQTLQQNQKKALGSDDIAVEFRWRFLNNSGYDSQSQYRVDITVERFQNANPVFHQSANRVGTLFDFSDHDGNGIRNYLDVWVFRRFGNPYTSAYVEGTILGPLMGNPGIRYGDFDGDGHCQFSDFVILGNNFGASGNARYNWGDLDLDGDVDFADFVIFSSEFEGAAGSLPPP